MFERKRIAFLLLALLACTACLFAACVPYEAPDDRVLVSLTPSDTSEDLIDDSEYLAENEYMTINEIISVTPTNVAVFGQLTEQAIAEGVDSVRITGAGSLEVQEQCVDNYFIISVDLPGTSAATFAANAMKGEETLGDPLTFSAPYDATAETRLDGNSVSVGRGSRLFFSSCIDNYLSAELYTASQVSEIKSTVASTYKAFTERAKGAEVGIVYVFLPDITTMDPSILREEDAEQKNPDLLTRYEQIVTAVSGTKAHVVDMQTVLQQELDSGKDIYDLYRRTDSHPTEYTSFLMYSKVMEYIASIDTDVTVRTLDDFTAEEKVVKGGNLVSYAELDPDAITETVTLLNPNFSYEEEVAKIKLYSDTINSDYSLFTTINSSDTYTGGAERSVIKTDRIELPNVLVYRDENGIGASILIADACDQTLLARSGDYAVSLTDAGQYRDKDEGKSMVDFIVVFVSESSIADAFTAGN